jgi:formate dehydrogenase maturation protein FdhE
MDEKEDNKKPHHKEKCPLCGAAIIVNMLDKNDGVRKVGCDLCEVWSDVTLSNHGAIMNLRMKMMLNPNPDGDDITDMDEFMAGYDDEEI